MRSRFGPVNEFNRAVVQVSTRAEFYDVLASYRVWREQFLDERGELKAQYRPTELVSSFMRPSPSAERSAIPVPAGPVEVW